MIKFAVYKAATGEILRIGEVPTQADADIQAGFAGEALFLGEASLDDSIDPATGQLVVAGKPAQPSQYHIWEGDGYGWKLDVAYARSHLRKCIEKNRDAVINSTIEYEGRNLDADERAQGNIKNKQAELGAIADGVAPTYEGLLMWRDADDTLATFADVPAMQAWLAGLTAAMARRGSMAYGASWARKAVLDATADADLPSFDPSLG